MADKSKRRKLLLLLLLHRRRKSTRMGLKSHWVRETFRSRTALGECHALIQETRLVDHTSFYKYFHMSPMKFDELLSYIGPVITRKVNRMRRPIGKLEIQFHTVTVGFLFLLGLSVVGGTFSKSAISFYQKKTLYHCWYHSLIVIIYFLLAVLIFRFLWDLHQFFVFFGILLVCHMTWLLDS